MGTPVSSTNKTDHHDITEILLKAVLKPHNPNPNPQEYIVCMSYNLLDNSNII
jgi:membrane-anchored protein YejM (alkaline phosphatase superfamily)